MSREGERIVVIGGTQGIGLHIAEASTALGARVTVTGRDLQRAESVAKSLDENAVGCACDLADWESIRTCFTDIGAIDHLVIAALDRDHNSIADFRPDDSARTSLMKNVGYATAVHHALPHFKPSASVVLFSGVTMWRPLPGSTTISMANAGVIGLTRSLAVEIAPIRVNAITPGAVANTPAVEQAEAKQRGTLRALREKTPGRRLPEPADIVAAAFALMDNRGITGENLTVDGGMRLV